MYYNDFTSGPGKLISRMLLAIIRRVNNKPRPKQTKIVVLFFRNRKFMQFAGGGEDGGTSEGALDIILWWYKRT
jgi:hypothetical protein